MRCFLSLLLVGCLSSPVWAQVKVYPKSFQIKANDVIQPTGPPAAQNASTHIMLKPDKYYTLRPAATKDTITEFDLAALYKDKGCPVTKGLDAKGCASLTYEDGTKRIICDKQFEAVITPDGKVHLPRQMHMYSFTFPKTPPDLPTDQSVLTWLNDYNDALLQNLLGFAYQDDKDKLESAILAKESSLKYTIYQQIINRVNLLEQFARLR